MHPFCRGRNVEGQCGQTSAPVVAEPAAVEGLDDVVTIAAGRMHSGGATADGQLYTWGEGTSGKLGHGNAEVGRMLISASMREIMSWVPLRSF